MPAETMDGEGDGPQGKFFSPRCPPKKKKEKKKEKKMRIFYQWDISSMHHFSPSQSVVQQKKGGEKEKPKWFAAATIPPVFKRLFETAEQARKEERGHSIVPLKARCDRGFLFFFFRVQK